MAPTHGARYLPHGEQYLGTRPTSEINNIEHTSKQERIPWPLQRAISRFEKCIKCAHARSAAPHPHGAATVTSVTENF